MEMPQPAMVVRVIVVMRMVVIVAVVVRVVVMIVTAAGVEKLRFEIQNAVEIEGIAMQNLGERHRTALGAMKPRIGINGTDARLDFAQIGVAHQVGLVEQDNVREGDLVLGLGRVAQPVLEPARIRHRDHRIELRLLADFRIDEERLCHRSRVGKPGGFHDDGVELALAAHQTGHDADQITPHRAADAAIVHFEDLFVGADDEVVIDADLAEFVDDDGVFLPMRLGQDAVEQGGLAGPEIAGQDRDGDLVGRAGRVKAGGTGVGHA